MHAVLEERARELGGRPFVYYRDSVLSYEELNRAANRTARGLQNLGVRKGDRVAVMLTNRPEFLFLSFGLSKLGAIEVPINTAHQGYLLSYMIRQTECSIVVAESQFLAALGKVMPELPTVARMVVLDTRETPSAIEGRPCVAFEEMTANDGDYRRATVSWSDPLVVLFTSGTTGPSKAAVLPQNYALHMGEITCESTGYGPDDCLYNALPLFHGNAKVLSMMPALLSGARMVLAPRFSAGSFWDEVRHYGCTEFNYIGGILPILLKAEPRPDDGDNPLRILMGGGASAAVCEAFESRFNVSIVEGYGMSEIGIPLMSTPGQRKAGACGKPHRHYEVRLVDDDGVEIDEADTPGELLVRPKTPWSMMLGYYGMPDKTVEAWRDLWFHTGDYLKRDSDGFFAFVDRKKDAIRRRGENISSWEVERIVAEHPAVLECAAIPVRSELGEDEVMVCIVLKPGHSIRAPELIEHCNSSMAKFMVPRYVRFMDALPKTPTERVQKYQLREEGVTLDTWDRERLR